MKRTVLLISLTLTGCSTAPLAGLLDAVRPGRINPNAPAYGGVGANPTLNGAPTTTLAPAPQVPIAPVVPGPPP